MKRCILPLFAALLLFTACHKDDDPLVEKQEVCGYLIHDTPQNHLVSDSQLGLADSLFTQNNIPSENLQVYQVDEDTGNDSLVNIRAYQYANGLKIFFSEIIFNFDSSGELTFQNGQLIENIDLGATPYSTQKYLTARYNERLQNDDLYKDQREEILSNCLDFEFGYFNVNAATGNEARHFIKTWRITPHHKEFPKLLVNDDTGEFVFYDNGVEI